VKRIWERSIRGLGFFTVTVFLVASLTPASNIIAAKMQAPEVLQPSDAIIVLGAGTVSKGMLKDDSMRRTIRGIELYKRGLAPLIVFSGAGRANEPTEAAVRAEMARALGVPDEAILTLDTTQTTREESIQTADLLRQRKAKRITLITDSLHTRRAKLLFERVGLEVYPAYSADYVVAMTAPRDRLWLSMRVAQESLALIYYRLAGYI
jgi:uncharacterized SAM-binding protein YcdF (DUF218 family)